MVIKPASHIDGSHYGYSFLCPGCAAWHQARNEGSSFGRHMIPTKPNPDPRAWDFDGNESAPTFSPSILVYEVKKDDGTVISPRCHSFVRAGKIEFLSDCGHALAGQTVPLPEIPEVQS